MLSDLRHCGVRHDGRPARAWQRMNTTMAPLEQIQGSLGELKRRHDQSHRSFLRRDNDDERNDNDGRGKRDDDFDSDDEEEGTNGGVRKNDDDDDDEKRPQQNPTPLPPLPPPQVVSTMTIPGAAAEPTTVVVVSTTTAPPSFSTIWMTTSVTATPAIPSSPPVPTSSTVLPTSSISVSPSNSVISTMFPASSSAPPAPTLPPWVSVPSIDDRPRKGLDPDENRSYTSTTAMIMTATSTIWTSVIIPQTALASSTVSALPDSDGYRPGENYRKPEKSGQLSDLAEHLLIAAGAIGAFIMVAAGIYFLHKMKKDPLASVRDRRFGRGGPRGWYGWRKQERGYVMDESPYYYGHEFPSNEKAMSNQQHFERQSEVAYSPGGVSNIGIGANAEALSRANTQRQEAMRQILLDNSVPHGPQSTHTSPVAQAAGISATQAFYNIVPQTTTPARQPSSVNSHSGTQNVANSNLADYNNTGNKNTLLSRQLDPQNADLARQPSDAFDPNPRDVNHMSYMSSLSSGFGDGLIIPEPTVNGGASRQTYRQSRNPGVSRFSWSTATPQTPGLKGDRDTIYTATSTDSAPRFRTINSWVAHQAGRVDKNGQTVPSMPPLPLSLQTTGISDHQRKPSEDPAFKHHPGEEIEIGKGSRVPSAILDTKTNVN
ncbi:hypothetical protein BKA64DRAFT_6867 [Cadophora sp. MPI-SDFR-AT-0126]|nr:hypothetical protein BKA64DRAFT_6867 [Leotiomycetes sp. MPI-SDFR-AT-0126]